MVANVFPGSHMMADEDEFFAVLTTVYFEVTDELGKDVDRDSIANVVPKGEDVLMALEGIYQGAVLPEKFRHRMTR